MVVVMMVGLFLCCLLLECALPEKQELDTHEQNNDTDTNTHRNQIHIHTHTHTTHSYQIEKKSEATERANDRKSFIYLL